MNYRINARNARDSFGICAWRYKTRDYGWNCIWCSGLRWLSNERRSINESNDKIDSFSNCSDPNLIGLLCWQSEKDYPCWQCSGVFSRIIFKTSVITFIITINWVWNLEIERNQMKKKWYLWDRLIFPSRLHGWYIWKLNYPPIWGRVTFRMLKPTR